MPRLSLISIFSGAGGLDTAFETTGSFDTRFMLDFEPVFCETLRRNQALGHFRGAQVACGDIRSMSPPNQVLDQHETVGLIGGPPCETFSSMGRRRATEDPRGLLIFEFLRWSEDPRFSFFVFENVPDLVTIAEGAPYKALLAGFAQAGYKTSSGVLCAANYGAATVRKRLIVVGARAKTAPELPPPTHGQVGKCPSEQAQNWVGSFSVINDLAKPGVSLPDHNVVKHIAAVVARFAATQPGSYDNVRKRSRLHPDRPSPSLVAGNFGGTRNHIHPTLPRELTNREIARIQGFSDNFVFEGTQPQVAKQIANAVPLKLGEAVARGLASFLAEQLYVNSKQPLA